MTHLPLTAANIKYLLTLHELDSSSERGIRCVDVARRLNITKPSVHTMIKNLRELGLVAKEHYGAVYMTEAGKRTAGRYLEYYSILKRGMAGSILLSDEDCRDLACKVLARTVAIEPSGLVAAPLYGSD